MAQSTVTLVINADGSVAIANMKKVHGEMGRLRDQTASLTENAKKLALQAAAAFGLYKLGSTIKNVIADSAKLAARVETLQAVLVNVGRNAGYSAEQMNAYAKGVEGMGITTEESLQTVIKMTQAHLDLSKASELARVAQDAAVIGNVNSSEALNRLIHGIQSAQVEVLRTIGLNVNFESSYQKAAAALGKTSAQLTETEKANIRMNAAMEAGVAIAGSYESAMGTVGKLMTSIARYKDQAMLAFGELFKPALGVAIEFVMTKLKELNKWFAEFKESGQLAIWAEKFKGWMQSAVNAINIFIKAIRTIITVFIDYQSEIKGLAAAIGTYYILKTIAAIAETGNFITKLKLLIATLEILTWRALTAFASKLGMIGLAIGGIVWWFDRMGQPDKLKARITEIEKMRAELVRTGKSTADVDFQLRQLRSQLPPEAKAPQVQATPGALPTKPPEQPKPPDPGELKKITDLNKKIQDDLDKMTMTSIELIHKQAEEWEKEGASRALVARWTNQKIIEEEQKTAKVTAELRLKDKESRYSIENQLDQERLRHNEITKEMEIQNRYTREREILEDKLAIIEMERTSNRNLSAEERLRLDYEELEIRRQIEASEERIAYELLDEEIRKRSELIARERELLEQKVSLINDAMTGNKNPQSGEVGELGAGLGLFQEGAWGLFNIEQGTDPYTLELERLRLFWEEKVNLYMTGAATIEQVESAHNAFLVADAQKSAMKRIQTAQSFLSMSIGIASMLYAASGKQSKELFYITKALGVAEAIVNAHRAYTMALAHPPGPPETYPMAHMALAMGLAHAAAIAATAFMGPSTGAGATGSATGGGTIPYVTPVEEPKEEQEETPTPTVINIHIHGNVIDQDKFAREILPAIRKAASDNG